MTHRVDDHDSISCEGCGAGGAGQWRHDTGKPLDKGSGRFELHCYCGHLTRYDVGCPTARHQAFKVDLATFLRSTVFPSLHLGEPHILWAHCPTCGSTLMYKLRTVDTAVVDHVRVHIRLPEPEEGDGAIAA